MHDARYCICKNKTQGQCGQNFLLSNLMKTSLPIFPVTMLPAKGKTLLSDLTDEGNVSVIL